MASARPLPIHRLDVETYGRMVDSGALEGQPVELLEGMLVDVTPQGSEHGYVITHLTRHLAGAGAWLRVQLPLEIPPDSVPEPDFALVRELSPAHHPRTALLVVEVAVSSYQIDRSVKAALYARAGVPIYWLVDVPGRAIELHAEPSADGYRRREILRGEDRVPSPAAGVGELVVGSLLPGRGA